MSGQSQTPPFGNRMKESKIIAPPFLNSQYVAAIPVQPIIATTAFPNQAMMQPIHSPLDYLQSNVVLTSAQNQMQDQLQRKHEELKTLIQQQQEELRRVSEQLMMARFGIVPAIVTSSFSLVNNGMQSFNTARPQINLVDNSHSNEQLSCHLSPNLMGSPQHSLGNEKSKTNIDGCPISVKNMASDTISPETSTKHNLEHPANDLEQASEMRSVSSPSVKSYSQVQ